MLEEFLPLFYFLGGIGGAVFALKYVLQARTERVKHSQKQKKEDNSVESVFDEFGQMLLDAPKYYPVVKAEITKIREKNPNADLGDLELRLKGLEWAAKHQMIARIAVPIAKPIALRYIKRIQRSL